MMMAAAFSVMAQGRSAKSAPLSEKMKAELSLDDTQWEQLKSIEKTFQSEQRKLMADTSMTREMLQGARKKLVDERNANVKEVLTEPQYSKWTAMKRRGPDGNRARNPMDEMKVAAGLSDEQAQKVMHINRDMAKAFRDLRSDSISSQGERKAAIEKIQSDRDAKIRKVLSDEQYKKLVAYETERTRYRRTGRKHRRP